MSRGAIFDIRRFSVHDGSGIRTTVFFKGCPLRCVWCQNPEGMDPGILPVYFEKKCIRCGGCIRDAQHGGMRLENGQFRLNRRAPEDWEELVDQCPGGALAMDGRICEAEELAAELMKDEVFFRMGGGVTLSGGEPLLQGEFAVQVLRLLKERGIHTAIETALYVPEKTIKAAAPYLDLIYADMKIADNQKHQTYVGAPNGRIRKNLEWILTSEYRERAVIRTPLIPQFTATEENLAAIAEFLSGLYPQVRYELLNYNPLAQAKYHLTEREYCFEKNPPLYTKEQMLRFGEIVKAHGIQNLILEI